MLEAEARAASAVFADEAMDSRFARLGFVRVRLLAAAQAAALRDELEAARRRAPDDLGCAGGIEQSFATRDDGYRRAAFAIVSRALEAPLLALLRGYRLAGAGAMVKLPGAAEMDLHRDRSCLADPEACAVNAWCALADIDDSHGNFAVLPGSHRLPNVETIGVERFYAGYGAALKPRCVSLSLAAGEAILFDHRILHWSHRNRRSEPRPVARATAIPADSRLVCYRLDEESGGKRFAILDAEANGPAGQSSTEMGLGRVAAPVIGYAENRNRPISLRECRARADEALGSTGMRGAFSGLRSAMRRLGIRAGA